MYSQVSTLTPSMAKELLATQVRNRPLSHGTVERYVSMMRDGKWSLTGEPLIIASNGQLIDGQHRCEAVVKSGVAVQMLVVYGAEASVFSKLGRGKTRSLADSLALEGCVSTHTLAAACKWLMREEKGSFCGNFWIEPHEGLAALERNPDVIDSVRWSTSNRTAQALLSPGMLSYAHYRAGRIDVAKRDVFFDRLESGEGLSNGNPIYALRERLVSNRASVAKLRDVDRLAFTIKAINCHMTGQSLRHLRWSRNAAYPEAFPTWVDAQHSELIARTTAGGTRVADVGTVRRASA